MKMAQEGTLDHIIPVPLLQPSPLRIPHQHPGAGDRAIEAASHSCGNISGHSQENEAANATEIEDDEVQFVFSVPRRKKKKRKRTESSCNAASSTQESEMSPCPHNSVAASVTTSSQTIRWGSTGIVQLLEPCHMGGIIHSSTKSGSLPTTAQAEKQHLDNLQSISSTSPHIQPAPAVPFIDETSFWDVQTPHIQGNSSFQFDICGMPFAEEILKKRKHDEEQEEPGSEGDIWHSQCSQNQRLATQTDHIYAHGSNYPSGLNKSSSDACASSSFQISCRETQPQPPSGLDFSSRPPDSDMRAQNFFAVHRDLDSMNRLESQSSEHEPHQRSSSVQRFLNGWVQQQPIQVPVSLVPDLSVSPRTKTVQVLRRLNASQLQVEKMRPQTSTIPRATPVASPSEQSTTYCNLSSINLNGLNTGHDVSGLTQSRFPPFVTTPRDILRKPSLYKIPPWPSPPISPHIPQYLTDMHSKNRDGASQHFSMQTQPLGTTKTIRSTTADTVQTRRPPHEDTKSYAAGKVIPASNINGQERILRPISSTVPPQPSSYRCPASPNANSPLYSSPGPDYSGQSTRKHSPNLIVDIAETCQENFPFAAVAERHRLPIQKVFDTFSAIIQLPLLRSAADNRRHGNVAKMRMKEFREAKKAMDRVQEQERRTFLRKAGKAETGEDFVVQKKSKKAPALLKAAILNNARSKED